MTTRSSGRERSWRPRSETATRRQSLTRLEAEGVVILDGEHVQAFACAWRLDALGLVSI
jgi:hypothetical protein